MCTVFRKLCRLLDNVEKMWYRQTDRQGTDDNIMHCMLYTSGYRHTSEYVILIDFPLQQWLYERTSMLLYTTLTVLLLKPLNTKTKMNCI
jgi:hypothetical protein